MADVAIAVNERIAETAVGRTMLTCEQKQELGRVAGADDDKPSPTASNLPAVLASVKDLLQPAGGGMEPLAAYVDRSELKKQAVRACVGAMIARRRKEAAGAFKKFRMRDGGFNAKKFRDEVDIINKMPQRFRNAAELAGSSISCATPRPPPPPHSTHLPMDVHRLLASRAPHPRFGPPAPMRRARKTRFSSTHSSTRTWRAARRLGKRLSSR